MFWPGTGRNAWLEKIPDSLPDQRCAGRGFFKALAALVWPDYFGGAVVGASACGFGLVAAFATLYPDRELTMLLFFVIPIRLLAKTLLILSAVLAVAGIIFPSGNIANAAHLGGMVMGFIFVRQFIQGRLIQWRFSVRRATAARICHCARGQK